MNFNIFKCIFFFTFKTKGGNSANKGNISKLRTGKTMFIKIPALKTKEI